MGTVLGAARDGEVLLARLGPAVAALRPEDLLGDTSARLRSMLSRDHDKAHAELVEALTGRRYAGLLDALADFVARPPLTARATAPPEATLALVALEFKRARRRARRVGEGPIEQCNEAWHDLRKSVRRLRYAAEAVVSVARPEAARFASDAKRVQDLLGERQDAVTALVLYASRLDVRTVASVTTGYTYGELAARESACIADAEREFSRAWRRLIRKKSHRWLERAH